MLKTKQTQKRKHLNAVHLKQARKRVIRRLKVHYDDWHWVMMTDIDSRWLWLSHQSAHDLEESSQSYLSQIGSLEPEIPCDHFPMIFCRGVLLSNYWVRKNLIHMEWKINHWCLKVLLTKNFLVLLIFAELPWKSNGPKISRDIDIREKIIVFLLKMTNIWKLVDRIFMEQCFWNFDSSKRKDQSWIAPLVEEIVCTRSIGKAELRLPCMSNMYIVRMSLILFFYSIYSLNE